MALIDYLSPDEAAGRAEELLTAAREDHGERTLFNEALAHNPRVLAARFEYADRLLEAGAIDPALKEFVFVVVSEANECEFCVGDHRSVLRDRFDVDEAELQRIAAREFSRLPEGKRAIAEFADQLARDPKRLGTDHIEPLKHCGYSDADVIELLSVATLAVSANTIVDALSIHPTDRNGRVA